MKAKIIETKEVFKPFTIELTIESEEELCDLLNRLNAAANKIDVSNSIPFLKYGALATSAGEGTLWSTLKEKAKESNLLL